MCNKFSLNWCKKKKKMHKMEKLFLFQIFFIIGSMCTPVIETSVKWISFIKTNNTRKQKQNKTKKKQTSKHAKKSIN